VGEQESCLAGFSEPEQSPLILEVPSTESRCCPSSDLKSALILQLQKVKRKERFIGAGFRKCTCCWMLKMKWFIWRTFME